MSRRSALRPAPLLAALLLTPGRGAGAQDPVDTRSPLPPSSTGPVLALSLEDALWMAVDRNLDLEVEALNTEVARYDYLGSWGAFDPVVTLDAALEDSESQGSSDLSGGDVLESDTQSFGGGVFVPFTTGGFLDLTYDRENTRTNNSFALFDTSTSDVLSVALTQPLLRNAWSRFATADQREAQSTLEQQRFLEEEVRQRVLLDVANAYWDVVGANEELDVRRVALDTGQAQLDQNRRRLDVGVGTEVDVLQAETNVAQLQEQLLLAQSNLSAAEDALRGLIFQGGEEGIENEAPTWDWPIVALTPLPEASAETPEWMRSLAIALEERPELARGRATIEIAAVRLDRAESLRLPQLDLVLGARSSGFDEEPSNAFDTASGFDFPTYSGGLTFSMPIQNRAARYGERAARSLVRAARIQYDQLELLVLSDVRAAVRELVYARESVAAAQKSSAFAERQLAAEEARYDEGLSTTFQVLEFQRDLAEARSALTTARARYAKALSLLRHAEGRLDAPQEAPADASEIGADG